MNPLIQRFNYCTTIILNGLGDDKYFVATRVMEKNKDVDPSLIHQSESIAALFNGVKTLAIQDLHQPTIDGARSVVHLHFDRSSEGRQRRVRVKDSTNDILAAFCEAGFTTLPRVEVQRPLFSKVDNFFLRLEGLGRKRVALDHV